MSVMETLNTRRTYRRFAQKPVSQDVVDDMVEALRLSSCGANRQAVKLVVVQNPEMVKKVHPLVKWAAYLPPEQGAPKADEQPVMYLAVVQDSSIPGDLNTDMHCRSFLPYNKFPYLLLSFCPNRRGARSRTGV